MRLSDGRLSRDGTKQVQVAGVTHGTRLRLSRVTEEPCMVRRGAGGVTLGKQVLECDCAYGRRSGKGCEKSAW